MLVARRGIVGAPPTARYPMSGQAPRYTRPGFQRLPVGDFRFRYAVFVPALDAHRREPLEPFGPGRLAHYLALALDPALEFAKHRGRQAAGEIHDDIELRNSPVDEQAHCLEGRADDDRGFLEFRSLAVHFLVARAVRSPVKQKRCARKLGVVERLRKIVRNRIALLNAVGAQLEYAEDQVGHYRDDADDFGNGGR